MSTTTTPLAAPRASAPQPPTADALFTKGMAAWLATLGENAEAADLANTPARVLRALREFTAGYSEDPAEHLARTFASPHSGGPIYVTDVPFTSICAHHLLPFTGLATIAYHPAPGAPVVGLSKLPRVLDVYARRLQTQEQLTQQVTTALDTHLETQGAACVLRSEHGCLAHRGARKPGTAMVTTSYTGVFLHGPVRQELHALTSR